MDRKIEFWGDKEDEHLTHTEMDEAIESALDGMADINALPETIEICGYARMKPSMKVEAEIAVERLIESLDEDYGDPDGSSSGSTKSMQDAAETFVVAVLKEYKCWACDLVKQETVNVQKWIKGNRPDWLEDKDNG